MKVIVAGGRDFQDYALVKAVLDSRKHKITEVVSGGARGADSLGERWANENGIQVKLFPAKWDLYGKPAGHIRNAEMAVYAEALVAFPGGRGTANMISLAKQVLLPILIVEPNGLHRQGYP